MDASFGTRSLSIFEQAAEKGKREREGGTIWIMDRRQRGKKGKPTGVMPWKRMGSWPGPAEKPNVHTALADLSSYAASRLFRPSWPREPRNHLLQDRDALMRQSH